ncbi:MAG: hypothetical protein GF403_03840 [Candidatus Coatesbacteria bacterium]|nr:hypothetical protein [Candidatus Coatesbacteria bacterium]
MRSCTVTTAPDWAIGDIAIKALPTSNGLLLSWSVTGDTPASVRVLRGESDPVAVSGSLPGGTTRWLDMDVTPGGSYVYWLEATDSAGRTETFGPTEPVVYPDPKHVLTLDVPWPNQASGGVTLSFALPEAQNVTLGVYDLAGRRVSVLIEDEITAGRHETTWDCSGVARGVCLIRRVVVER